MTKSPTIPPKRILRLHQLNRRRQPLQINNRIFGVGCCPSTAMAMSPLIRLGRFGRLARLDGRNGIDARLGVLHLPDPPQAVQRAVVEVEHGVARRRGWVAAGVDAVDVVACRVDLLGRFISSAFWFLEDIKEI
jgi:hypothetical protein